jgi:hypothetical protein
MAPVNEYGPATLAVEETLERAGRLTAAEQLALWEAYRLTRGEGPHSLLLMPRDYAWRRFHDGLDTHGLRGAFNVLWGRLQTRWSERSRSDFAVQDAVCATLLTPFAGAGPFRVCDTLMSPGGRSPKNPSTQPQSDDRARGDWARRP